MIPFDIGQLNRRITILTQSPTSTRTPSGQTLPSWVDGPTIWASIKPMSGKLVQLDQADTKAATGSHQIVTRYTPLLTIVNRLRFGNATVPGFDSMTSAQFDAMRSATFDALTSQDTPGTARYFTINDVRDIEEARVMMMLTVTEVKK